MCAVRAADEVGAASPWARVDARRTRLLLGSRHDQRSQGGLECDARKRQCHVDCQELQVLPSNGFSHP